MHAHVLAVQPEGDISTWGAYHPGWGPWTGSNYSSSRVGVLQALARCLATAGQAYWGAGPNPLVGCPGYGSATAVASAGPAVAPRAGGFLLNRGLLAWFECALESWR